MRVVFLGNPYFGYVYTYAFDPHALGDLAYAVAEQEQPAAMASDQERATPRTGRPSLEWLSAWLSRRKKEVSC